MIILYLPVSADVEAKLVEVTGVATEELSVLLTNSSTIHNSITAGIYLNAIKSIF